MDSSDKYVGRILDNRYEVLELIGAGGMALVYKARCHRLNRMVAIKILKDDLSGDEEFRRRFHAESQAVAMLSHPNIVAVYDVSRSGETEYIVMELIEGISLKQYINRKGLLTWKEALHFSTQITKALCHAHSRGIIHRDIKPHNIMILKDGSVKVADFGIARLLAVQNTLTQETLGSVHYISPEQAKGGNVDARSDIYSVGVVMYEMLTSRLPFVGDSAVSIAIQHISAIPLMPRDINPDIPEGLEDIAMHAMEPDLNHRYTTADEMLCDLEDFRKNPAMLFSYSAAEPRGVQADDDIINQSTKVIPATAQKAAPADVPERAPRAQRRVAKKPEMTSDEYRTVKKRAASTSTLIGVFSIIVFIIVVLVFMWNYLLKDIFVSPDRELITIPSFVGEKYDVIVNNPGYSEIFSFNAVYEPSENHAEGVIMAQSPLPEKTTSAVAGRKVEVTLTVSQGEAEQKPVEMPYLLDKHYSEAKNILDNLRIGLTVETEVVENDIIPKGYVIQTIPAAGVAVFPGNLVKILYSTGPDPKTVKVPNMVGSSKAELESAFGTLNLKPDFRSFENEAEAGTVTFIARIGDEVPEGTTIVVHISTGPPESPSPSVSETPTPSQTTETTPPETSTSVSETPTDTPPTDTTPSDDIMTDLPPVTESPAETDTTPVTDMPPLESVSAPDTSAEAPGSDTGYPIE
ncbi:MAG: Stk1 family PASTA domain-containing Ser/Thr kinase [Oscillospiraceae bacterium]|nr:Stk1 family PASTA domain-containing Ser/Thr kinase [Oscillospiraceae bacterium]